jgi:hypothetical protein
MTRDTTELAGTGLVARRIGTRRWFASITMVRSWSLLPITVRWLRQAHDLKVIGSIPIRDFNVTRNHSKRRSIA